MADSEQNIRIVIVEDNLVVQEYLKAALRTVTGNEIVGIVADGLQAIDEAVRLKPDIILLDLFLPGIDGIDVIHQIMNQAPCPIVVISGELDRKDRNLTFEAQRAGAVSVLAKPCGMEESQFYGFSENLCHTVKLMSQVKVTRRWFDSSRREIKPASHSTLINMDCELLLVGSSTGGPAALYKLLEAMPATFPFAILIAQHIAQGFAPTLCEWLCRTACRVSIPEHGEKIQPGRVYLAPDNRHMIVDRNNRLLLVDNPDARFTPSVDMLFESVARNSDHKVCAVLLTGMGNDGTAGMASLYHKGVLTIAEAESSCVIFGMPKMAIAAGVVRAILTLDEMCSAFGSITGKEH